MNHNSVIDSPKQAKFDSDRFALPDCDYPRRQPINYKTLKQPYRKEVEALADAEYYLSVRPPEEKIKLTPSVIIDQIGLTENGLEVYNQSNPTICDKFPDLVNSKTASGVCIPENRLVSLDNRSDLFHFYNTFSLLIPKTRSETTAGSALSHIYVRESGYSGRTVCCMIHEFLHSVYHSMDFADRYLLNQHLRLYIKENPLKVEYLMSGRSANPANPIPYLSEVHSVLGSEVVNLGIDKLEDHYSNYLVDRQATIANNGYVHYLRSVRPLFATLDFEFDMLKKKAVFIWSNPISCQEVGFEEKRQLKENLRIRQAVLNGIIDDLNHVSSSASKEYQPLDVNKFLEVADD